MDRNEFNKAFYEADHITFNTIAPILKNIFPCDLNIEETNDGDRVDINMTATTTADTFYTLECKRREGTYTYKLFKDCENAYYSKEEEDLTNTEKQLGQGLFIKGKKIKALLERSEGRRAYYCVYFPDDVLALWKIDENTTYGECYTVYHKYNVHRGQKETQHNYTLQLKNADFIWNNETKTRIQ